MLLASLGRVSRMRHMRIIYNERERGNVLSPPTPRKCGASVGKYKVLGIKYLFNWLLMLLILI